jgi:hypothetical protein
MIGGAHDRVSLRLSDVDLDQDPPIAQACSPDLEEPGAVADAVGVAGCTARRAPAASPACTVTQAPARGG